MLPAQAGILITGATGTIGRAIAQALAAPGRRIAIHFNNAGEKADSLRAKVEGAGARAHVIKADLSKSASAERLVDEAVDRLGCIDLLVHAAAIFERTPFGKVTEDQWDRIMAIDLKAAFFIAQAAGIAMQRDGGKMIFFSDVAAVKPYAGYLPYCIAKAGIDSLVRGLARSLAPKILVNAIAPYVVTRPAGMSDAGWNNMLSKMPTRKAQTPDEIAAVVKMLAESGESITGQIIAVDGGRLLR